MIEVIINPNFDFERQVKAFERKVEKSGILQLVKQKRYYIKPSEEKRTRRKKK